MMMILTMSYFLKMLMMKMVWLPVRSDSLIPVPLRKVSGCS